MLLDVQKLIDKYDSNLRFCNLFKVKELSKSLRADKHVAKTDMILIIRKCRNNRDWILQIISKLRRRKKRRH